MAELPLPFQMQPSNVIARPPDLPDFEHPPVVEVALSAQFEPLVLETKHIAILWEQCRKEFPDWQDQAPIAPAFELFGDGSLSAHAFLRNVPLRRAMFRNALGTQLKQYQADRFVRNWTKASAAPDYPRYESVREAFAEDLRGLTEFVENHSLGNFAPNQCEVTYVNLIPLADSAGDLAAIVSPWSGKYSDSFLLDPESSEISAHFVMRLPNEPQPLGRLHIAGAVVTILQSGKQAIQLTLTARGQPIGAGVDGVITFLNLGRQYIVKGFASFTTPEMHETWGRRDGIS
jgi:uncharacterized protein (TIGR04255 family)